MRVASGRQVLKREYSSLYVISLPLRGFGTELEIQILESEWPVTLRVLASLLRTLPEGVRIATVTVYLPTLYDVRTIIRAF